MRLNAGSCTMYETCTECKELKSMSELYTSVGTKTKCKACSQARNDKERLLQINKMPRHNPLQQSKYKQELATYNKSILQRDYDLSIEFTLEECLT